MMGARLGRDPVEFDELAELPKSASASAPTARSSSTPVANASGDLRADAKVLLAHVPQGFQWPKPTS